MTENKQLLDPLLLSPARGALNESTTLNQSLIDKPFTAGQLSPSLGTAAVLDENAGGGDEIPTNRKKAIFFQNLFLIFQFIYNALSKWLMAQGLSLLAIQVFERGTAFLCCALVVAVTRVDLHVPKQDRVYMLGRTFVGVTGSYSYLLSVKYLPISVAMILFFTGPFWATILAYFALGEMINLNEIIAMVVAFSGVVVICTATQAATEDASTELDGGEVAEGSTGDYLFGTAMAIYGAITFAVQSVIVRKMNKLNAYTITFWYTMACTITLCIISLIEAAVKKEKVGFLSMSLYQTLGCMGLGALFYCASQSNTIANQSDKSGFVTLIGYLGCCYAVLGDIFLFHATFSIQEIIGMSIVFAVMIYLASYTIWDTLRKKND